MVDCHENTRTSARHREEVRALDSSLCFVERERTLWAFDRSGISGEFLYARAFAAVMDEMSTPVAHGEQLAGRLVLGPLPEEAADPAGKMWLGRVHSKLLFSPGHMTLDHRRVVTDGLAGILHRATDGSGDPGRAGIFAENARLCLGAIRRWLDRYAAAARTAGNQILAETVARAPWFPSRTFHEGLQACWITHLLLSGVVGGRDFGFGRLDQILWPLLDADLVAGRTTEDEALGRIQEFFVKLNELAGNARGYPDERGSHQPTPCTGTKQYLVLGGTDADGNGLANRLSFLFLDAARAVRLREPVLHVRYDPECDRPFRSAAVSASVETQGQVQFANEVFTTGALLRLGVPPEDAREYGASACSRLDLGATHGNGERWLMVVPWLMDYARTAEARAMRTFEDFFAGFLDDAAERIRGIVCECLPDAEPFYDAPFINGGGPHFHLESLFLADCVERKRHLCEGGGRYRLHLLCFVGIATLTDCLAALRKVVYDEHRLDLAEFLAAVDKNFDGHDDLLRTLRRDCQKFGNDDDAVDDLAARTGRAFLDAVGSIPMPPGQFAMGCFYSLIIHLWGGKNFGATFDGRRAGEPFSENQSPVYGADRAGRTALLNSLAKLPFDRAASGSLNLLFPCNADPENLRALLDAWFRKGGSMVGLTFADRAQLEDAMAHPERHPFLQVRMHGFSEYFVNMPREEQEEVLARTCPW